MLLHALLANKVNKNQDGDGDKKEGDYLDTGNIDLEAIADNFVLLTLSKVCAITKMIKVTVLKQVLMTVRAMRPLLMN